MFFRLLIFLITGFCYFQVNAAESMSASLLCSTASDPDAIVDKCVNAINGDYCEVVADLVIPGPDPLILQRFHNSKPYVDGASFRKCF
jgi:hypothetical protein